MNNPIELRQDNKRGSQSTQIAEQNNYYGMDYQNTRALCLDLIKDELDTYKNEAETIARERDEKLLKTFFERLYNEKLSDENVCEEFKNPDMQYTYVEAQKAYIRLGTQELEDMLADLLVCRVKENKRTLFQITLSEAMTVVPMLLPEQLDILALCFRLGYTKSLKVNSINSFFDYLNHSVLPHISSISDRRSLYQHLVYAKVGSIDIGQSLLEEIISEDYGGLFLNGYTSDELQDYLSKYPTYFTQCHQNPEKIQVNATSTKDLSELLEKNEEIDSADKKNLQDLFAKNMMSKAEIKNFICKKSPNYEALFNLWNNSDLKHLSLTSVGMVLGASRAKQLSGDTFDLNIWI